MIAFVINKNLGLMDQPAERRRVHDTVAVALIDGARGAGRLLYKPAPAFFGVRRIGCKAGMTICLQFTPLTSARHRPRFLLRFQEAINRHDGRANISVTTRAANRIREIVAHEEDKMRFASA